MAKKIILVAGATGTQGGAVVDQLANHEQFHVLAVTRNPSSEAAKRVQSKGDNVQLIQGNLNDVPALFESARAISGDPIYGVYSVQISQGKNVSFDGEIKQGTDLIDASVAVGVKFLVYSSVERGGDAASWDDSTPVQHFQTKYHIERHLREHAGDMGWTILRPVAFMDNLTPGVQARVFVAALRDTMREKPNQWVASKDIGVFARLAFENPQAYNHRAIGLAGDEMNVQQLSDAFEKETGQPFRGTFGFLGSLLKRMLPDMGIMIHWFADEGYKADIAQCRQIHPGLLDMKTWIRTESPWRKE